MRCLDSITDSIAMNLSKFWEIVKDGAAWRAVLSMGSQRIRHDSKTEQQQHTEKKNVLNIGVM